MNKDVKKLWTAALRSGKYTQGFTSLVHEGYNCANGVLCEVAREKGLPLRKGKEGNHYLDGKLSHHMSLPNVVRLWAGLSDDDEDCIIVLNDKHNKSFTKIADWIEENL